MKFPYGISDFHALITEGYFYIDRSDKIAQLEAAGKYLLLLRPRRFGKSLLLSMLENYYDVAKADQFQQLFGHLSVAQRPTSKHNQYFVMQWDFSAVDSNGPAEDIRQRLHNHVNGCLQQFISYYEYYLDLNTIQLNLTDAAHSLQSVLAAIKKTPYKLYLLIDEYDNFANEILMARASVAQQARYQTLIQGEGALKAIFKVIKAESKGAGIDRIFITGVAPVVMSDVSSGFNIAKNIYLDPQFNDLCGFKEAEIRDAFTQMSQASDSIAEKADEALTIMRTFYNGYSFTYQCEPSIYNSTNSLYFLDYLYNHGQYPREMLDDNLSMDQNKLSYITQLPHGAQIVARALDEAAPLTLTRLASRFGVEQMLRQDQDLSFMASLLYYFGILTFAGHTSEGELILTIPNLTAQKLYLEPVQNLLLPDFNSKDKTATAVKQLYQNGDISHLCDCLEKHYFKVFDNRDYRWTNELTIKTVFLSVLFNDTYYIMDSESTLERSYADLIMRVRPDMRQYKLRDILIEFKYISLKEAGLTADTVKNLPDADLKAFPAVKKKLAQAKTQLTHYQNTLSRHYETETALQLSVFTVIAVGYERLLWEKS